MPSLKVPRTARTNSTSSMRSESLKARRWGTVASPTPTVPMSSDSISRIETGSSSVRARAAAAIQPAVPPPTMTMLSSRVPLFTRPIVSPIASSNSLELDAERAAYRAWVAGDVADRIQAAAVHHATGSVGVDVIDEIVLVGHVQEVEAQVERGHVAHREILGDLQVQGLVTIVAVRRVRRADAGRTIREQCGRRQARQGVVRNRRRPGELAGEGQAPRSGI